VPVPVLYYKFKMMVPAVSREEHKFHNSSPPIPVFFSITPEIINIKLNILSLLNFYLGTYCQH